MSERILRDFIEGPSCPYCQAPMIPDGCRGWICYCQQKGIEEIFLSDPVVSEALWSDRKFQQFLRDLRRTNPD